jgi:hypothetical protein
MKLLALVVVLVAGCGGAAEPVAQRKTAPVWGPRDCTVLDRYRVCYHSDARGPAFIRRAIEYRSGGTWRRLRVADPMNRPPGQPVVGHWRWVAESPDGGTLLAQWSAECEIPVAFFVSAEGGKPRAVARDRYGPATSTALGWTSDGRAIVELPSSACGAGAERPGVYLVDSGTGTRDYWKPVGTVEQSLETRDVG